MDWIPLVKPSYGASEEAQVLQALHHGRLEGDGPFTKKVHQHFETHDKIKKALFTTSCTDALELSALLLNLMPGDEVIVPSYTFVSTAHAFALRGAKIVFADSEAHHPNVSLDSIRQKITPRTKAVVPVHYAGFSCDMEGLMDLSRKHGFIVIADAAQAFDSKYKGSSLLSWGHMSTLSFHQTKNLSCGEGGLLAINDERFIHRAEIIREKGTNRSAFFRGEVDKYNCVDIGSSYLGSDLHAALLCGQLDHYQKIQSQRMQIWQRFHEELAPLSSKLELPRSTPHSVHNAHCYYVVCQSLQERTALTQALKERQIGATFHYLSLHKSPYYKSMHDGTELPMSDRYTDCLLRLPLYPGLKDDEFKHIVHSIKEFYNASSRKSLA
jgi:dTDP-4-amino-4,6-dideoxygalactose transaminase